MNKEENQDINYQKILLSQSNISVYGKITVFRNRISGRRRQSKKIPPVKSSTGGVSFDKGNETFAGCRFIWLSSK